ncbi:MAG: hypothetical protein OEM25_01985, partial [Gammaproteobacteria bacterium]|nr:hypothetical protein [Gammaproteobacteria bacterium]
MDKQTFLIVLLSGQFALLTLDVRERFLRHPGRAHSDGLRPATLLFLAGTIAVYGALQYGGLALVPTAEELLVYFQAVVSDWLSTARTDVHPGAHIVVVVG